MTYSRVFPTSLAKLSLSSVDSLSRFCWVEINPSGVSDFDIGEMVTDSEIDWETKNILRNSKTELDNRNNHFFPHQSNKWQSIKGEVGFNTCWSFCKNELNILRDYHYSGQLKKNWSEQFVNFAKKWRSCL